MAVLGLCAGWSIEPGAVVTVLITLQFVIHFNREKNLQPWMKVGFVFLAIGAALLFLAPGNFHRLELTNALARRTVDAANVPDEFRCRLPARVPARNDSVRADNPLPAQADGLARREKIRRNVRGRGDFRFAADDVFARIPRTRGLPVDDFLACRLARLAERNFARREKFLPPPYQSRDARRECLCCRLDVELGKLSLRRMQFERPIGGA